MRIVGLVEDDDGQYGIEDESGAHQIPGLVIYRFDAALLFFNTNHDRVRAVIAAAWVNTAWLLFDAESTNLLDVTAADALTSLHAELASQGIVLAIARAEGMFRVMLERTGVAAQIGSAYQFPCVFHTGTRVSGAGRACSLEQAERPPYRTSTALCGMRSVDDGAILEGPRASHGAGTGQAA